MMKMIWKSRFLYFILLFISFLFAISCDFPTINNYQVDIQQALNESYILYQEGDSQSNVTQDIYFVNCNDTRYDYQWTSDNQNIIDNFGHVTRTDSNQIVVIELTISSAQLIVSKDFELLVIKKNSIEVDYTYDIEGTKSKLSIYDLNDVSEDNDYSKHLDVIAYIHKYHKLPKNYLTKSQAKNLGWKGSGNVWTNDSLYGKCIGGDTFNNREGILPSTARNTYIEVDVNCTNGNRGAYRIVYNRYTFDIYYTDDHYESFTYMIGEIK